MEDKKRISLKVLNRQKVYRYIYQHARENAQASASEASGFPDDNELGVSRQQITYDLRLSLQTVTQCLNDLLASGKITEGNLAASTGGRPAVQYLFQKQARVAIGVEIRRSHFTAAASNLLGELAYREEYRIPFSNQEDYYRQFCDKLLEFIDRVDVSAEKLLGISIALQAMINDDSGNISYAMLLQNGSFPLEYVRSRLPFPVHLIHDAEAAGMAEAYCQQDREPALYLMLNENLGSAFLLNGEVLHSSCLSSGTIEHMKLRPGGDTCYCGKHGCAECYCSAESLQKRSGRNTADFFEALRSGEKNASLLWAQYLTDLAALIDNARMVIPCQIILGGVIESFLQESDLVFLKEKIRELSTYSQVPVQIIQSKVRDDAVLQGATMHMLLSYLEQEELL